MKTIKMLVNKMMAVLAPSSSEILCCHPSLHQLYPRLDPIVAKRLQAYLEANLASIAVLKAKLN